MPQNIFENKKAAMEMSVGTIVTIVLLMSVLILGLILIKSIFTGAKYNIDAINDKVTDEINKLFAEDKEMIVYLANHKAEIKQGENWGVAWAVKNLLTGVSETSRLSFEVYVNDPEIEDKCDISENLANKWIISGKSGDDKLNPGQIHYDIARISIPENAPLCTIRYSIETTLDDDHYSSDFFDVEIKS